MVKYFTLRDFTGFLLLHQTAFGLSMHKEKSSTWKANKKALKTQTRVIHTKGGPDNLHSIRKVYVTAIATKNSNNFLILMCLTT